MQYPERDQKLRQVESWVDALDQVLPLVGRKRVAVQAGGAVGIWPAKLAEHFDLVLTFEPCPENWPALVANAPQTNIRRYQAALGAEPDWCTLALDHAECENAGAWYVGTYSAGNTPVMRLDDFELWCCDFIQLDVEGAEFDALRGAKTTILATRPVVMIEEKPLPHMSEPAGRPRRLLESWGYREAMRVHRDVVMVPE